MSEISRNNHYVPQFYLENWGTDKKIWKYQLLVSNENVPIWNNVSIKYTASQKNLYVRVEKGNELDDFEKMFDSLFEAKSKNAIEKAIKDERLSINDWSNLIEFIGAQIVRTPAFYQKMRPVIHNVMDNAIDSLLDKLKQLNELPKCIQKRNESDRLIPIQYRVVSDSEDCKCKAIEINAVEGKNTWMWAMRYFLEKPLKVLYNHNWSIITCDEELPTSDDPVICLNYYSSKNYNFDYSWNQQGTEIYFPISPHKILYTQVGKNHPSRMKYDKVQSRILKEIIVKHAFREIYTSNEDTEITGIRRRYINADKYEEEKQMLEKWYYSYQNTEGKML